MTWSFLSVLFYRNILRLFAFSFAMLPGFPSFLNASPPSPALRVLSDAVVLNGPESSYQLLVDEPKRDLTHRVRYEVKDRAIATVTPHGLLEARSEGSTEVRIRFEGETRTVRVEVRGIQKPTPVSFEQQVIPLLTKASCNRGGCHGKAEGQNGFKLSVFGFDPDADYAAIVSEARGRRVMTTSPEHSLLVQKGTGRSPHGGGRKIAEGSLAYQRLVRWIAEGAPRQSESIPPITSIVVEPSERLLELGGSQQLHVTAIDAKGQRHCVTAEAEYDSNDRTIAGVDSTGHIQAGKIPGQAAILVRYLGHVAICNIAVPRTGITFTRPPESNFVDKHVWDHLQRLGIPPSGLADDATFLRRVFLDVIGTLPTVTEARDFLDDRDPRKREKLIDRLLERPEYADVWSQRWADVLRVDRDALGANGAIAFSRWLRTQLAENRPYDQFVRDIVLAEGKTTAGPAGLYKSLDKPDLVSRSLSQLFLGVRIECAQCHHHPSDRWGQDDYYALAGFFTGVTRKVIPTGEAVVSDGGNEMKHPRTGKDVPARVLGGAFASFPEHTDRRIVFADWLTSRKNPYFARAIVNRLWAHYFGRGLIEPIDDLRSTNPAANEPLLAALSQSFVDSNFDVKRLTRTILTSRTYQLAGANASNASDEQCFSHARSRTLPAEVLLDAICQVTAVPEKFNGIPEGIRAIQLWDNRMPSYFLTLFGRPARTSVCECERSTEPSIAQALHLMNSPEIEEKIRARRGRARQLSESNKEPAAIIDELSLATLARFPTADERKALMSLFESKKEFSRREAVEDALWTLLNTKEFLYNR